ncbi:MAG: hypothetical protein ACFFCW_00590 [Candidatus Hodarchaeota archaeon]
MKKNLVSLKQHAIKKATIILTGGYKQSCWFKLGPYSFREITEQEVTDKLLKMASTEDEKRPQAYYYGYESFIVTFRIYKIAMLKERSPENLKGGWWDYHFLKTLCESPKYHTFYDFAENKWVRQTDDFLPSGWPDLSLSNCNNFLQTAIQFSWEFYFNACRDFRKIGEPKPRQKTDIFLSKINKAFERLAENILEMYGETITDELIKKSQELLIRELGLYQRQLGQKPKTEYSFPLTMTKWAEIFKISENKLRELRDANIYHFDKVSPRKWRLPKNEIPTEYLEKYRRLSETKTQ